MSVISGHEKSRTCDSSPLTIELFLDLCGTLGYLSPEVLRASLYDDQPGDGNKNGNNFITFKRFLSGISLFCLDLPRSKISL